MGDDDGDGLRLNIISSAPKRAEAPVKQTPTQRPGERPAGRRGTAPGARPPVGNRDRGHSVTSPVSKAAHAPTGKAAHTLAHGHARPTGKITSLFSGTPLEDARAYTRAAPPAPGTSKTPVPPPAAIPVVAATNVPLATSNFTDLGLSASMARLMHDRLRIERPTAIQAHGTRVRTSNVAGFVASPNGGLRKRRCPWTGTRSDSTPARRSGCPHDGGDGQRQDICVPAAHRPDVGPASDAVRLARGAPHALAPLPDRNACTDGSAPIVKRRAGSSERMDSSP